MKKILFTFLIILIAGLSHGTGRINFSGSSANQDGEYDLNGEKLTLDADGDTSITADTDDQIDIEIGGADVLQVTGSTDPTVVSPSGELTFDDQIRIVGPLTGTSKSLVMKELVNNNDIGSFQAWANGVTSFVFFNLNRIFDGTDWQLMDDVGEGGSFQLREGGTTDEGVAYYQFDASDTTQDLVWNIDHDGVLKLVEPGNGQVTIEHNGTHAELNNATTDGGYVFTSESAVTNLHRSISGHKALLLQSGSVNDSVLQIASDNVGNEGSSIILTNQDGASDGRHWVAKHKGTGGSNDFILSYDVTAADGENILTGGTEYLSLSNTGAMTLAESGGDTVEFKHNGTDAVITSSAGDLVLVPFSGSDDVFIGDQTAATCRASISATGFSDIVWREGVQVGAQFQAAYAVDQLLLSLGTRVGNQMVITDDANVSVDHDHASETDPALYIHSSEDPNTDNTEFAKFQYVAADDEFVISTGKGKVMFEPADGTVSVDAADLDDGLLVIAADESDLDEDKNAGILLQQDGAVINSYVSFLGASLQTAHGLAVGNGSNNSLNIGNTGGAVQISVGPIGGGGTVDSAVTVDLGGAVTMSPDGLNSGDAVLMVDNNTIAGDILQIKDNGAEVWTVANSGFLKHSPGSAGGPGTVHEIESTAINSSGEVAFFEVDATVNASSTAGYVGIELDVAETATGSGKADLIRLGVDGANIFVVNGDQELLLGAEGQESFKVDNTGVVQTAQNGGNTIRVESQSTTGTTPADISTISTNNDNSIFVKGVVTGIKDDGSQAGFYAIEAGYKNDGGTLTESFDNTAAEQEDDATWDCTISVDGTNIEVVVTGGTGDNVVWASKLDVTVAS